MGPVPLWKVCHIIVVWCAGGSVTTLSLGETGTRATAAVGVAAGVGLAVACAVGAAVGGGAAVAVAAGVAAARVGALVAAAVGAGVDGAIVAVGAIVGAGVDGAMVAGAGGCVGASVASSPPQAMISRDKTISAPTKEYTRQYLDHCILFMLRCLLSFTGESDSKTVAGGLVMVASILGVSNFFVNS